MRSLCGKVAPWHEKAAKTSKTLCLAARYATFILALTLPAASAWSKTNIGTAGSAVFELNDGSIADKVKELVKEIRFAAVPLCSERRFTPAVMELKAFLNEAEKGLRADTTTISELDFGGNDGTASIRKSKAQRERDQQDAAVLASFRTYYFNTREVKFPNPCPPPTDQAPQFRADRGPPVWLTVQGGGLFTRGQDRTITGTDVFTPGAPEVDQRSLSGSDSSGLIGGTATVPLPIDTPFIFSGPPAQVFLRTGIIVNLGDDLSQDVSGINVTPMGTGTIKDKLKWYVPVLVGIAIPVTPTVTAELFGGVHISRRDASLSLTETGAGPGGLPIDVSKTWTSIDPAVGGGLQFDIGRINGLPVRIGIDGTVSFVGSESLNADSPNFATQSYQFETGRKVETSVMFGLSIGLP